MAMDLLMAPVLTGLAIALDMATVREAMEVTVARIAIIIGRHFSLCLNQH